MKLLFKQVSCLLSQSSVQGMSLLRYGFPAPRGERVLPAADSQGPRDDAKQVPEIKKKKIQKACQAKAKGTARRLVDQATPSNDAEAKTIRDPEGLPQVRSVISVSSKESFMSLAYELVESAAKASPEGGKRTDDEFLTFLSGLDQGLVASAMAKVTDGDTEKLNDIDPAIAKTMRGLESIFEQDFNDLPLRQVPDELELQKCLLHGVDVRSKWGQRFARSSAADLSEYKQMTTNAKQAYRKESAKVRLQEVQQKKEYVESYQRVDSSTGTYVPFFIFWKREGGAKDPGALAASVRHAKKALRMGPPWVTKNRMTDRIEFLHLERSVAETFSKCWSMYEIQIANKNNHIKGNESKKENELTTSIEENFSTFGEAKKQCTEETWEEKVGEGTRQKDSKRARLKTPIETLLMEAIELKKLISTSSISAKNMLDNIQHDEGWKFMAGVSAPLTHALDALQKHKTSFARIFLSQEIRQIRKQFPDDDELKTHLEKFKTELKDLAGTCAKYSLPIIGAEAKSLFQRHLFVATEAFQSAGVRHQSIPAYGV